MRLLRSRAARWHARTSPAPGPEIRAQADAALGALREADRRKDEFLAVLSHELRNPLMPIRNSLYVLEHAAPGSDPSRRAQAIVDRQVAHIARLVDDLLDVTRIARGKIALRKERVDLGVLVRRAVEDHRGSFGGAGVALEARLPATPLWAGADPTRLAQVVGNLLHDAVKFTPRGGWVRVTLAGEGGSATLLVALSGHALDEDRRRASDAGFACHLAKPAAPDAIAELLR